MATDNFEDCFLYLKRGLMMAEDDTTFKEDSFARLKEIVSICIYGTLRLVRTTPRWRARLEDG